MSTEQNEVVSQFNRLKSSARRAVDDAGLTQISRDLSSTSDAVQRLPEDVAAIRRRGYAFAAYLEHKLGVLADRWQTAHRDTQMAMHGELQRLRTEEQEVEMTLNKGAGVLSNPAALETVTQRLEMLVEGLERSVRGAESRLRGRYETIKRDVDQTVAQLKDIEWYLEQADEASFDFLAGEKLFLVAEAEWKQTGRGKDDPDGLIYLTDQRLVFEQKEKTGKKLGLFGGKQTQELEWELPLHQVEGVTAENKGLFGGKDLLHFTLGSGAPFAQTTVEVKGKAKCKFWEAQIQRMISGDVNDERAIQPDEETLEKLANAPTDCPVCGATLPMLVANQRQVECMYCGTVIRV